MNSPKLAKTHTHTPTHTLPGREAPGSVCFANLGEFIFKNIKLHDTILNCMVHYSTLLYKISNDSLRNQILSLYQNTYERYHHIVDYDLTHIQKMDDLALKSFVLTEKDVFWNIDWNVNQNFIQLENNIELKNYISANRSNKYMLSKNAKKVITEIKKTISIIDNY